MASQWAMATRPLPSSNPAGSPAGVSVVRAATTPSDEIVESSAEPSDGVVAAPVRPSDGVVGSPAGPSDDVLGVDVVATVQVPSATKRRKKRLLGFTVVVLAGSLISLAVMKHAAPHVSDVSVTSGDGSLAVGFNDGGDHVSKHKVRLYLADVDDPVRVLTLKGNDRTVPHLDNGKKYRVQVAACGSLFCGSYSSLSESVMPYGRPPLPVIKAITTGSKLSFTFARDATPVSQYSLIVDGRDIEVVGQSVSQNFGCGEVHTYSGAAANDRGTSEPTPTTRIGTAPCRFVIRISHGAYVPDKTCGDNDCDALQVSASSFPAHGTQSLRCFAKDGPMVHGTTYEFTEAYDDAPVIASRSYYKGTPIYCAVGSHRSNTLIW